MGAIPRLYIVLISFVLFIVIAGADARLQRTEVKSGNVYRLESQHDGTVKNNI